MKLIYSDPAIVDLIRLRAFIAESNPDAASRVAQDLVERIDNLLVFPYMGRPVDLAPDPHVIRDMVFGKYVVRYAVRQEVIAILRIWHHAEQRGRESPNE
jgi:plasmid stabilization system protein ParE